MKKILFRLTFSCFVLFFSCKKSDNNNPTPPPPPPVPSDTLATGWKKINFIDSSDLVDIFFINNNGFAISTHIFKSSDGGNNWSQLTSPSGLGPNSFVNIGMGSEMNAIFVSPLNQLVSTHNAGASFTIATLSTSLLTDVFFIDSTIAYAVGKSVWKTIDGGDNWTKLYDFTASAGFNSLFFTNEQTGWVLKQEGVYKTINGGIDWQLVNTGTINLSYGGAIFFLNPDTGYISNQYSIEKTVNAGASWNKVFTCTDTTSVYHDIHFVSENAGYITDGSRIFKTTDGGNTWTKVVALASSSNSLVELHFTDANHGWACGQKGTILKYEQ
ncbi:MAG: YCF48-related protein [Ginsengibacter sp.]